MKDVEKIDIKKLDEDENETTKFMLFVRQLRRDKSLPKKALRVQERKLREMLKEDTRRRNIINDMKK